MSDFSRGLRILLTPAQYAAIKEVARRRGYSRPSEWARVTLVRELDLDVWAISSSEPTPVPDSESEDLEDDDAYSDQGEPPVAP